MIEYLSKDDVLALRETPQKEIDHIRNKRSEMGIDVSRRKDVPQDKRVQYLNLIVDEIRLRTSVASEQIFYIGQLLHEAKQLLAHGNYENWIERHLENISISTAHNCRRVYETFALSPSSIQKLPKSILYFLSSNECDEQLREAYLNAEEVDSSVTLKELKTISVKMSKGDLTIESPEVLSVVHEEQGRIKARQYSRALYLLKERAEQFVHDITQIHNSNPIMAIPSAEPLGEDETTSFEGLRAFASDVLTRIDELLETYRGTGQAARGRARAIGVSPLAGVAGAVPTRTPRKA